MLYGGIVNYRAQLHDCRSTILYSSLLHENPWMLNFSLINGWHRIFYNTALSFLYIALSLPMRLACHTVWRENIHFISAKETIFSPGFTPGVTCTF